MLQKTLLGWIISGNIPSYETPSKGISHCGVSANISLKDQLEKFWKIEEISVKMQPSCEEHECEDHFISNHSRDDKGRFIVRLPFKGNV